MSFCAAISATAMAAVILYRYLVETGLTQKPYTGLLFHYLQPDVDWHNRILMED